jgi:arylsulfatase A-like enzyme
VRQHLHDYYACISSLDHHLGRIVQTLKDVGEYDDTVIVFSSDHGLAIGSHGLFGKQNLYEHSMRSPLVLAGPGVPRGQSDAFAYLFDIYPTLCELAGVAAPPKLDGQSLAPIIRGEKKAVRDAIFLAYMDSQRAVRRGDWKLIRYPQVDHTMLFNLRDDPDEVDDVAADGQRRKLVDKLMTLLAAQQQAWGDKQPLAVDKPRRAQVDLEFFK